jgi:hypothetical protein
MEGCVQFSYSNVGVGILWKELQKMALVFKENGMTVTVQTRDHRPPHVHVDSSDSSVKVDISGEEPKLLLMGRKKRVKSTEAFEREALRLVADNLEVCREAWRQYHGNL